MANNGNLPPQAYTRETLVKAYEWLKHQAPNVREKAISADSLVNLYLQAKRRITTDGQRPDWEAPSPASVEAFKSDLRNLAEDLRQFENPSREPILRDPAFNEVFDLAGGPTPSPTPPQPAPAATGAKANPAPVHSMPVSNFTSHFQASPPSIAAPSTVTNSANAAPPTAAFFVLDPQSREWVADVVKRLNLTNETDAVRALIAVGYKRLREILPRP